jgi:hypothetical protein
MDRIQIGSFQALNKGWGRLFLLEAKKKIFKRRFLAFNLNKNPMGRIQHITRRFNSDASR